MPSRGLPPGIPPLIAFSNTRYSPLSAELDRDLGIALARVLGKTPPTTARGVLGELASDRLTLSLKTWRGDVDAWLALSLSRSVAGEVKESRTAAAHALALAPDSEIALAAEADVAVAVGDFEAAVRAATRLIERNPTAVEPRVARAVALVRLNEWTKAERDCREALHIHPLYPRARLLLAVCLNRQGDSIGGRKEAETAAELATQRKMAFLEWYQEQTR
jgi:predicted Zn-dependent protease